MKSFETLYHEPRVYAYTLPGVPKLAGWIKVGYTDRQSVAERIAQQLKTPLLDYRVEMDEAAVTNDGRFFRDSAIHELLEKNGFPRARFDDVDAEEKGRRGKKSEWFKCSIDDVVAVVKALQGREEVADARLAKFTMRPEQRRGVKMTADYFRSHSKFYGQYRVNPAFGGYTGVGKAALEAVSEVIGDPLNTMSITLTCGKLTTGVTIPAWSAIFMLRNLSSPETYFRPIGIS